MKKGRNFLFDYMKDPPLQELWDIVKDNPRYADKVRDWMNDYIETGYIDFITPRYYMASGSPERTADFLRHTDERNLIELGKIVAKRAYVWSKGSEEVEYSFGPHKEYDDVYRYQMTFMLPKKKSELALEDIRERNAKRETENTEKRSENDD